MKKETPVSTTDNLDYLAACELADCPRNWPPLQLEMPRRVWWAGRMQPRVTRALQPQSSQAALSPLLMACRG